LLLHLQSLSLKGLFVLDCMFQVTDFAEENVIFVNQLVVFTFNYRIVVRQSGIFYLLFLQLDTFIFLAPESVLLIKNKIVVVIFALL